MPPWLGTTIVVAVVAALVGAIVYAQIRAKKQGKTGCGCGCEHCTRVCHQRPEREDAQK